MKGKLTELIKAAKFAVVGVANTLVDMGIFALLAQVLGWNIYLSQFISYCAGALNSYGFNRSWTFASGERFFSRALVRFIITSVAMLLLSMLLLWLLHEQWGWHKLLAKCGAVAVTLVANFVISRLWVFSS